MLNKLPKSLKLLRRVRSSTFFVRAFGGDRLALAPLFIARGRCDV